MSVDYFIMSFHRFLIDCWPSISLVLERLDWEKAPYFLENWMQANWELIVEEQALESGELLAPYGYNSSVGCRYTRKDAKLTHEIICKKKGKSGFKYKFLCFVSIDNGVFRIEPPFDFVDVEHVETGDRLSLAIDEVEFFVEKLT